MSPGFFYAMTAAITWGLVYTLDQKILSSTSPAILLLVNSTVTALILAPVAVMDHRSIVMLFKAGPPQSLLVVSSLLLALMANLLIFSGIKLLGAPSASIIEIAYPFFVAIFSSLLLNGRLSLALVFGGMLIFLG